eukprot:scaffold17120_cov118-Isochrysis_galbana.AAC.1
MPRIHGSDLVSIASIRALGAPLRLPFIRGERFSSVDDATCDSFSGTINMIMATECDGMQYSDSSKATGGCGWTLRLDSEKMRLLQRLVH